MYWKNELEGIEDLLLEFVHLKSSAPKPSASRDPSFSRGAPPAALSFTKGEFVAKCNQAKRNIRNVAFGLEKPKQRRTYLQRHQHVLMRIWNLVFKSLEPKGFSDLQEQKGDSTKRKLLKEIYAELEQIHEFFRTEYSDCFNMHEQAAAGVLLRAREEIELQYGNIIEAFVKRRVQRGLASIIITPYQE